MSSATEEPDTLPPSVTFAAISGESRRGRGHDRNDDRWAVAGGNGMLVAAVADGMGFTVGGGWAATVALRAVLDVLTDHSPGAGPDDDEGPEATVPYDEAALGEGRNTAPAATTLLAAVGRGQQQIMAATPAGVPEAFRAGTTLTAALIAGDRLHLAHLGDSSCWLHRRGRLRRLTEIHTSAEVLVAAGAVDPDSEAARRLDNLLTRYVGMTGPVTPQVCSVRLRPGDRVLLASDGLTRSLDPAELGPLLARSPTNAADLVDAAIANGARDDVTAVLLSVVADYAVGGVPWIFGRAHDAQTRTSGVGGEGGYNSGIGRPRRLAGSMPGSPWASTKIHGTTAEVADMAEPDVAPASVTEVRPSSATRDLPAASVSDGRVTAFRR